MFCTGGYNIHGYRWWVEYDGVGVELFIDGCAMVGILLLVCMGMESSLKIREATACNSKT